MSFILTNKKEDKPASDEVPIRYQKSTATQISAEINLSKVVLGLGINYRMLLCPCLCQLCAFVRMRVSMLAFVYFFLCVCCLLGEMKDAYLYRYEQCRV